MATSTFRLHYLAKAAAGVPRDLVNTFVSAKIHPIRPTVLIYNCTWVCDARCTMCNNWKWGDRKSDMTLAQLEPVMNHPFWGAVENLNISGGEPTTRNDLPEIVEMFQRHLPRLRKIGINTTGLTPHRAIPMLTRIVEFCAKNGILISIRVSLDGIGDVHNQVRDVKRGFEKASQTIEAMQALSKTHDNFQFGIASTIFATNMEDAENILAWARTKGLDVVFNMLRFTDAMLHNKQLEEKIGFREREETFMRKFFLDRVQEESVLALRGHDRERLSAHHAVPVPEPGPAPESERRSALLRELREARQRARRSCRVALFQGREPDAPAASQGQGVPHLSESVPGQRRRDEAVRALRKVPQARLPGEKGSTAASRHDARARTGSLILQVRLT
jgi:molybdenum cofactor biosynthesis enzyme MoaA